MVKSATFDRWLDGLRDRRAKARIEVRLRRLSLGNPGDVKSVGDGILELRIDHGPGYRVYFMRRGVLLVVLLCGGDKSSQQKDIAQAKLIAEHFED
ncbi:MAG: addiction module antitoxin RelB [Polycyclovorans sp.]|nr:addiction module antitoxin RelB [Polycyclovorans sp.]